MLSPKLDELEVILLLIFGEEQEQTVWKQIQFIQLADGLNLTEKTVGFHPELVLTATPIVHQVLRVMHSETR